MDWNTRFEGQDYVFGTSPSQFLPKYVDRIKKGGRVMCVADGEGRNSVWLAEQGFDVTCWDFSPNAVAKAEKLAAKRGVEIRASVEDALNYNWGAEEFDAVIGVFIQFIGPPERDEMLRGMLRATAKGGAMLLHGYTPEQIALGTGGPKADANMYTEDRLKALFPDADFEVLERYRATLDEGQGHSGASALIDCVIRA